jgi:arginase
VSATRKLLAIDMVELNPVLDTENKTGRLAVWLIQSALGKTIL